MEQGLTVPQAINALMLMSARLSRLVAMLALAVGLLALLLIALTLWIATSPMGTQALSTLAQTFAGWPAWLAGALGLGGFVTAARVLYKAYHWVASRLIGDYLMKGLGG